MASLIESVINKHMVSEWLDTVDEYDAVIGRATREETYTKKLKHRIVHVFIFRDDGSMVLNVHSNAAAWCPGYWATPVGGHVLVGETYEQAAIREYQEEMGVTSPLTFMTKEIYSSPELPDKMLAVFRTCYNGPFYPDINEVERVESFTAKEIRYMMDRGEKFCPELRFILNKYFL